MIFNCYFRDIESQSVNPSERKTRQTLKKILDNCICKGNQHAALWSYGSKMFKLN